METLISPIPLLTAGILVVFMLALLIMCWRTQSLHFLLRRFWLLVHGNKDIPDAQIQAFAQDQTSLYAFRLFSGTQVNSLEQAHQLIAWCQQQQVPVSTISACGDCFDLEKHEVITDKLPGKPYRAVIFIWLVTLTILITGSVFVAISAPGLAKLKITDRLIVLNENSARVFWGWPFMTATLNQEDCKYRNPEDLKATTFSAEEIKSICGLFDIKEWREHSAQTQNDQRNQLLILAMMMATCFFIQARDINKHFYARELHKKLTQTKEIEK